MSWWWSKNNCTIAMHDSRKKNYLCSWKEPKGDTSICLPYGRLSLLFITSGVLNSTFCSLHLSFCPLAGSWQLWVSCTLRSPLEQPYITCQQVLLSTWEWESRRIGFLQGANYMLSGAEGVQSTPNCAGLESAELLPEGYHLSSPWCGVPCCDKKGKW